MRQQRHCSRWLSSIGVLQFDEGESLDERCREERDVPPATTKAPISAEARILPEVKSIVTKNEKNAKRMDKLKKGREDRQRPESEEEQEAFISMWNFI